MKQKTQRGDAMTDTQNRKMTFSVFHNRFDTHAKPVEKTWGGADGWLAELSKLHVTEEKDTFCVVLGDIAEGRTHADACVNTVHAMGLDLDGKTDDEIALVYERLLPHEFLMYSSFNHLNGTNGAETNKWRIILPLAEPAHPDDFKRLWDGLNAHIGNHNDPQTKNAARLFYIHSCPEARRDKAATVHNKGEWISSDFILRQGPSSTSSSTSSGAPFISLSVTPEELIEEGRKRTRRSKQHQKMVGKLLRDLGHGRAFAKKGERDKARFLLCQTIAEVWPYIEDENAKELFRPSLERMHEAEPLKKGVEGTLEEIIYKLGRAKVEKEAGREEARQVFTTHEAARIAQARGDGYSHSYDETDIAKMRHAHGVDDLELRQQLIVYRRGGAYFLNARGYDGPFAPADVRSIADIYLRPFPFADAYTPPNNRGIRSLKQASDLFAQHGSPVLHIEASLVAEASTYDRETKTLTEAVAPRNKNLKPTHHPEVDKWLRLLGGEDAGKLLDWVAAVPQLSRQCCALYLWGAKGVGKTLLTNGLAPLWGRQDTTPLEDAVASFNEGVAQMPLIVADEYLPDVKNISGKIRELIGSKSHTLNRKFLSTATLTGAIRLVILANTPHLLDLKGDHTTEDIKAIAERFLLVRCKPEAAEYLKSLHREKKDEMLERGIAEHCLWLAENWEIQEGKRFLVEGDLGEAVTNISINNERTSLICEWLIEYISLPNTLDSNPRLEGLIQIDTDEAALWVNSYAVQKGWDLYMDCQPLTARGIGIALKAVADKDAERNTKRERVKGRQRSFHKIDCDLLAAWSEEHGRMRREDIAKIVGGVPF